MPQSHAVIAEESNRLTANRDAPTRFDLYDLERELRRLVDSFPDAYMDEVIDKLTTQVNKLAASVDKLTKTVVVLSDRVETLGEKE